MKPHLAILVVVLLGACGPAKQKPLQEIDERLVHFSISECQKDCTGDSGIRKNEVEGDTLIVQLGYWMNCVAKDHFFLNKINMKGGFLNIGLNRDYPNRTECSCYFIIDLKLIDTATPPSTILIDGFEFVGTKLGMSTEMAREMDKMFNELSSEDSLANDTTNPPH